MHVYEVTVGTRSGPTSECMDVQLRVLAATGQDAGLGAVKRTKERMAIATGEAWIEQIIRGTRVDVLAYFEETLIEEGEKID